MRSILQLAIALLAGYLAYKYFGLVLPDAISALIGLVLLVFCLYSLVTGNLRLPLLGGPVLLAWPCGAILAKWVAHYGAGYDLSTSRALALSWIVPLLVWKLVYAISQKRDQARDLGGIAIGLIVLYVVIASLLAADPIALMFAAGGAAAAAWVAHQHLIVPPAVERYLLGLGGVGGLAGVVFGVRWLYA